MAITYVGGTTGNSTSPSSADYAVSLTSLSGGVASAPATGDIVIVCTSNCRTTDVDVGVSTAGYTELCDLFEGNDDRKTNMAVSYKIMGVSPDTSVTCIGSGSADYCGTASIQVWRSIDQTTPIDVTITTATGINTGNANSPTITPVTSGAVVLSLAGIGSDITLFSSITEPSGYSNKVAINSEGSGYDHGSTCGIASKVWSGSGAEDPGAWTVVTSATSMSWCAATVVLRNFIPVLTASYGSNVLSGIATLFSVVHYYLIQPITGYYTQTGFASSLQKYWRMITEYGTHTLTGIASVLHKLITLIAGFGSYILTGFANKFGSVWIKRTKNISTWTNRNKNY
jgi:hypothetical protein